MAMNRYRTARNVEDPIRVDWLPVSTSGRIGITCAPGRKGPSLSGARWARDLGEDLDHLADHHEARLLVCLLEDRELVRLKIPDLVPEARKRSIEVVRFPIEDGGTPEAVEPVVNLVGDILARAAEGKNVVIHCAAGLGRSGVVGGSVLIAQGKTAKQAIAILHEVRSPYSPENLAQKDFLREVGRHYGSR